MLFAQGPEWFAQLWHELGRHFHITSEDKSLPELVHAAALPPFGSGANFAGWSSSALKSQNVGLAGQAWMDGILVVVVRVPYSRRMRALKVNYC